VTELPQGHVGLSWSLAANSGLAAFAVEIGTERRLRAQFVEGTCEWDVCNRISAPLLKEGD